MSPSKRSHAPFTPPIQELVIPPPMPPIMPPPIPPPPIMPPPIIIPPPMPPRMPPPIMPPIMPPARSLKPRLLVLLALRMRVSWL